MTFYFSKTILSKHTGIERICVKKCLSKKHYRTCILGKDYNHITKRNRINIKVIFLHGQTVEISDSYIAHF